MENNSAIKGSFNSPSYDKIEDKNSTQRFELEGVKGKNFSLTALDTINENGKIKYNFIQKLNHKLNYIKLNIDDHGKNKVILIKVSSLANRLFLDKKDIREAVKNQKLESLIAARQKILQPYSKALSHYFEDNSTGELFSKNQDSSISLSRETLEKVLWTAFSTFDSQQISFVREIEGSSYFIGKDDQNKPHILLLNSAKEIGEGGFGTAIQIINVATGKFEVLKTSHKEKIAELIKENQNLLRLNKNLPKDLNSIQDAPWMMVQIGGELKKEGLLGKKYNLDNAEDLSRISPQNKLKALVIGGFKLSRGLSYLTSQGMTHGDIKPSNIFVNSKNGEIILKLADFGGANFYDEKLSIAELKVFKDQHGHYPFEPSARSNTHLPFEDIIEIDKARQNDDIALVRVLNQKSDVFALGSSLCEMIGGAPTFTLTNHTNRFLSNRPIFEKGYDKRIREQLIAGGCNEELISLIMRMIEPNIHKRIGQEELVQEWGKIAQALYPEALFDAYCPHSDENLKKELIKIQNNPTIYTKETFGITSYMPPNHYSIYYLEKDPKTQTYQLKDKMLDFDSKNGEVTLFTSNNDKETFPVNEMRQRFGLPYQERAEPLFKSYFPSLNRISAEEILAKSPKPGYLIRNSEFSDPPGYYWLSSCVVNPKTNQPTFTHQYVKINTTDRKLWIYDSTHTQVIEDISLKNLPRLLGQGVTPHS